MLVVSAIAALAALSSISGAPLVKRISQEISASTFEWERACRAAGGGQQCNPLSIAAFSTLLAAPGPCAQQDAADNMIDLARQLGNDPAMIRLTQIFRQQPRNTPEGTAVLYCQQAPRNQELAGLFQCQFAGVNDNLFTANVPLGSPGTFPFGKSSALSPPGSCPANPGGKIPDGTQLVKVLGLTAENAGNGGNGGNNSPPPSPPASIVTPPATSFSPTATAAPAPTTPANQGNGNTPPASGFQLQNAKDAQALNAKFATLAVGSPCTVGEVACINGNFAQCPSGTFQTTGCAGGTKCFALPLVNKPGTSITCTTEEDAARRFEAAGLTGVTSGNTGNNTPPPPATPSPVAAPAVTPPANQGNANTSPATGFQQQNAKDAQALNVKFASLAEGSPCTVGEVACINGSFAQCPFGTFQTTGCSGGTTCLALPLVNKAGTSVTCTTADDAARRFAAAGVTGGFNGSQ